jgi:hypothetical protein
VNGRTTTVIEQGVTVTTTVQRHRVRLDLDRRDIGAIVTGLALVAADARYVEQTRTHARDLLWRIVDDASGPSRTIDRRTPPEVEAGAS